MLLGKALEEVEDLFDHLEVVLLVVRNCGEQTRKAVNEDQAQVNLHLLAVQLGEYH